MSCARWTVPEGVALVSCENMQVGSDVREDGSAGVTEPAGGGQIKPAAVIFAKGAAGPAGTLKDQVGPSSGGQIRPAAVIFAKGAAGPAGTLKDQAGPAYVNVKNLESAMMTSVFLLEEAVISNYDVSNINRQLDGSAMMMSAVISSQSAVEQKQYQQLNKT
ncbi:respiratory burst oxidaseprotein C-like [Dorcoceras hygrometricum]|uniref:Respiratory burst oxidaseprotein C-like n=1 Tax=Dorcoceras hygrometricum TaxID=472368 RepID=A0A2Z7D3J7_9LAMI|nr:respiratory burst oxidaseprotein C-like [Dorcoceras hygrometricum]